MKGLIALARGYTKTIFALPNTCWESQTLELHPVDAGCAFFAKCFFNLSADACGIGTFCTDGFPEAENSAMQHIRDCAILDLHKLVCPKKLEVFMATRTICFPISGYPYCREQPVTFTWIKGSKRQNIRAVHDAVHTTDPDVSILEVSSASVQPEGEAVSSLRLLLLSLIHI